MERKRASDFPQEILNLFDLYVHGDINRRAFLDSATKVVGVAAAGTMLEALTPDYALAQQIAPEDKRIKATWETYDSPNGTTAKMKGYLARPASASATTKLPGVIVIHENRGLNPYIQDVVRRLAVAGYMAFGPDALTSLGGYPGNWGTYTPGKLTETQAAEVTTDDNKGVQMQGSLDGKKLVEDFVNAANWLKSRPDCTGKIGTTGFCYGGGIANTLAVRIPDLAGAAPYYGAQPSAEDTAKIKAPLCLHYAGLDTRITGGWEKYKTALDANHVKYEVYIYDGANHGFHNDTTARYDEAAAKLSWQRTLDFFGKNLKG